MEYQECSLAMVVRDENGGILRYSSAGMAYTRNGGKSVLLGLGYIPGIENAQPGDVIGTIFTPIPHTQPVEINIVNDPHFGEMQEIWFDLSARPAPEEPTAE